MPKSVFTGGVRAKLSSAITGVGAVVSGPGAASLSAIRNTLGMTRVTSRYSNVVFSVTRRGPVKTASSGAVRSNCRARCQLSGVKVRDAGVKVSAARGPPAWVSVRRTFASGRAPRVTRTTAICPSVKGKSPSGRKRMAAPVAPSNRRMSMDGPSSGPACAGSSAATSSAAAVLPLPASSMAASARSAMPTTPSSAASGVTVAV